VLALKTDEAEAYNGLGLASIQLGKSHDAAEFFGAALQARPDFAPALLNLATVSQQYLHDNRAALANYQAYLLLTPRPANYAEVKTIVSNLEQSDAAATVMAPAVIVKAPTPPPEVKPRTTAVETPRPPPPAPRRETEETYTTHIYQHTTGAISSAPAAIPVATQNVEVQPEPKIVAAPAPKTTPPSHTVLATPRSPATNVAARTEPLEVPMPEEQTRPGFWHRLFNSDTTTSAKRYHEDTVATTMPATNEDISGTKPEEETPADTKPAPAVSMVRYNYTSPPKPVPGDRRSAEGAFTKARLAEQDESWADAEQWYQSAADLDPSWFEAQYNTGVIAYRLKTYSVALPRYELALAIQPDSVDARYNFALALKASGYAVDAADELKKILAANPDEVRAHLALANLCAQSLHDVAQARRHYLKVLDLQPNNPQAADIRFWLSANAK
jgi:tetratricopeptide (TPR) repeat protein